MNKHAALPKTPAAPARGDLPRPASAARPLQCFRSRPQPPAAVAPGVFCFAQQNLPAMFLCVHPLRLSLPCWPPACLLVRCSSTPEDKTAGWTTGSAFYAEARDEPQWRWARQGRTAVGKLEGRAAGTPWHSRPSWTRPTRNTRVAKRPRPLATLDRFMKLHPPAPRWTMRCTWPLGFNDNLGMFSYSSRAGTCPSATRKRPRTFESFRELTTRFPESRYAQDARLRMTYIVNSLAQYEVHVARAILSAAPTLPLFPARKARWRDYQAVPATGRSPVHPDPVLRCPGADPVARRRAPRHGRPFPQSRYLTHGLKGKSDPCGSSGKRIQRFQKLLGGLQPAHGRQGRQQLAAIALVTNRVSPMTSTPASDSCRIRRRPCRSSATAASGNA